MGVDFLYGIPCHPSPCQRIGRMDTRSIPTNPAATRDPKRATSSCTSPTVIPRDRPAPQCRSFLMWPTDRPWKEKATPGELRTHGRTHESTLTAAGWASNPMRSWVNEMGRGGTPDCTGHLVKQPHRPHSRVSAHVRDDLRVVQPVTQGQSRVALPPASGPAPRPDHRCRATRSRSGGSGCCFRQAPRRCGRSHRCRSGAQPARS